MAFPLFLARTDPDYTKTSTERAVVKSIEGKRTQAVIAITSEGESGVLV